MKCTEWLAPAVRATVGAAISSSSLMLSVLLVWVLLVWNRRTKRHKEVSLPKMHMVTVFITLTALEIVPEASVMALASVSGYLDVSLGVCLFLVSFVNFSSTALAEMAQKPTRYWYSILYLVVAFSLGTLTQEVSFVLDHFELESKDAVHILVLVVGVFSGMVLFMLLVKGEHWRHGKNNALEAMDAEEQLRLLKQLLHRYREQLYSIQSQDLSHYANASSAISVIGVPAEEESSSHRKMSRLDSLKNLVSSLEHARGLRRQLSERAAMESIGEVESAVNDVLEERIGRHLEQIEAAESVDDPLVPSPSRDSLRMRALKLLAVCLAVSLFSAGVAFGAARFFFVFCDNPFNGYMHGFFEGLAAGMLVGKISGTMVPKLQAHSFRSHVSVFRNTMLGVLLYTFGVCFSLILSLIPALSFDNP